MASIEVLKFLLSIRCLVEVVHYVCVIVSWIRFRGSGRYGYCAVDFVQKISSLSQKTEIQVWEFLTCVFEER